MFTYPKINDTAGNPRNGESKRIHDIVGLRTYQARLYQALQPWNRVCKGATSCSTQCSKFLCASHAWSFIRDFTLVQPVNSSIFAARRSCPCPFKGKGPNPSKRSKWGCHYSVVRFGQDYSRHRIAGRCVVFSIVVSGLIVFITIL